MKKGDKVRINPCGGCDSTVCPENAHKGVETEIVKVAHGLYYVDLGEEELTVYEKHELIVL